MHAVLTISQLLDYWEETERWKRIKLRQQGNFFLKRLPEVNMNDLLMQKSIVFGSLLGAVFGVLIGAAFGAITTTLNGILIGSLIGLVLGIFNWHVNCGTDGKDRRQHGRRQRWSIYRAWGLARSLA